VHLIETRQDAALAASVASAFALPQKHPLPPPPTFSPSDPIVNDAIRLMEARLHEPPAMRNLARACGISVSQLEHRFIKTLNTTPSAYLRHIRLAKAHRLANQSTQSVTEIAKICGFSSQSALARAFRQKYGCSIRQLRQNQNGKG
jgi:transcriptional regulator GlxA family with amidase domain